MSARTILAAAGAACLFTASLVAGALLHLDLPSARRLAVRGVNEGLAPLFEGRLTVERIGALGVTGIRDADVRIDSADGRPVIVAHGVRAKVHAIGIVRSVLFGAGEVVVDVFDIRVDTADVRLDSGETVAPEIADVFVLRAAHDESNSRAHASPRGLRLTLAGIQIGHAWAHGKMRGVPAIDADVDELRAGMLITRGEVLIDASRLTLNGRGMPEGADPTGLATAHLAIPIGASREPLRLAVTFVGEVGGVALCGSGSSEGSLLHAAVEVPEVAAKKIRRLFPEAPIFAPVVLVATAEGPLSSLAVTGHGRLGDAPLDLSGELSAIGTLSATGKLDARHLDLRSLAPTAPSSSLDVHGQGAVAADPNGRLAGQVDLEVDAGTVAGQQTPPATLHVAAGPGAMPGSWAVDVGGNLDEPGAPTRVSTHLHPRGADTVADFEVKTDVPQLAAVRRLGGLGPGSMALDAKGTLVLASPVIVDVAVDARLSGLQRGSVSIARAQVRAHARGAATNPELEGELQAQGLRIEGRSFSVASLRTSGTLTRQVATLSMQGDGGPEVEASGAFAFGPSTVVSDARVVLSRGGASLETRVRSARLSAEAITASGVTIAGPGIDARGDMALAPGVLVVRAESTGVDLENLGHILGTRDGAMGGRVSFTVDLRARRDGAEGSAVVDLQQGRFARFGDGSAHVEATMSGRRIEGSLHASAGQLGTVDIDRSHAEVGGDRPLSWGSWRHAWGDVAFHAKVDLARLKAVLPAGALPFADLVGQAVAEGHATRTSDSDYAPTMVLSVKTVGLHVGKQPPAEDVHDGITTVASTPWRSSSVDVQLDARIDGNAAAELAARLVDKEGAMVALDVKSNAIPYEELVRSPVDLLECLERVPFAAELYVPTRSLRHFPTAFQLPVTDGKVTGSILVEGTALSPRVAARVMLSQAILPGVTRRFDADLEGRYEGGASDVTLDVRTRQKEHVFQASAHVDAAMRDLVARDATGAWGGWIKARLDAFPLAAIEVLSDRHVKGTASGQLEILGLHQNASLRGDVRLDGFEVGTAAYTAAHGVVVVDGKSLDAQMSLEQASGSASASAKIGTTWGASLFPARDAQGAVVASFQAKALRLAVLTPFLRNTADELDGVVDADAKLSLVADQKPVMQGSVALKDGRVELSALGEEFHGVTGKIVLTPDGIVRVEDVSALGASGKVTASGTAQLDGVKLVAAHGLATITKKEAMPIYVQGSNMGTLYGRIEVKGAVSADQRVTGLDVSVPSLHVELPDSSSHVVQGLEPAPGSRVGVFREPDRFTLLPMGPPAEATGSRPSRSTLTLALHLGDDVEIRRGTDVRVGLRGDASVRIADKTTVQGQIHLERGRLIVQGKKFEIETGTVAFVGDDPSNPQVSVTAGWTAPDGTRVHADFVGPLKTGRVKLRSEPARSQDEIASLIMFGSADGSTATPYTSASPDTGTSLGTSVGGFATEGLSRGLDQLTGLDVTTKLDTSTVNPRPELEVQIARDISLQIAVVLGTPPPGTNLDTTYATIDWRFFRNWSLATTFGDKGSSIADVIWRHRY